MVGCQPKAPAAFTPGEIPGTHFQRMSGPQGTWFCRGTTEKKSPVIPLGINPGTVRLVAQRLNHYATPGPDKTNVEPEMYDCTSNNWSHWNSNEKLKEKFGRYTRKTFDRFTTKDSYTWNITDNTVSTAV